MFIRDGKKFEIFVPHTFDSVQFPAGYFADAQARAEHSITEVPDPVWPDTRFYDVVENQDGSLTTSPKEVAVIRDLLKQEAAAKRWAVMCGGITLPSGLRVLTEPHDVTSLDMAITNMERYGLATVDFKAASGWILVTAEELKGVGGAVTQHLQSCYSRERQLSEQIDAMDFAQLTQFNAETAW